MKLTMNNIRELQKIQLDILLAFDKACREMGLSYTLSSGTLLGAVRHGGFIPWDDDVDVAMLREDYEVFLKEGHKYLPDHLFIQHYETDPQYPHNFIKLIDTRTKLVEYVTSNLDMRKSVFIDVFPIDRIPNSKFLRIIDRKILAFVFFTKHSLTMKYRQPETTRFRKVWSRILRPLGKLLGNYRLNQWETALKTKYNHNSKYEYTYGDNAIIIHSEIDDSMIMPISVFEELEEIEFENHCFMAMKNRDLYLRTVYGDDYMEIPPKEKQVFKHEYIDLKLTS